MKSSKVIGYIGAVTLGGLGVAMALANPSPPNYEAYAVQRLTANTRQQNFIFFSIYTTDLSVSSMIPSYHFETVGALQNFYTYKAQER